MRCFHPRRSLNRTHQRECWPRHGLSPPNDQRAGHCRCVRHVLIVNDYRGPDKEQERSTSYSILSRTATTSGQGTKGRCAVRSLQIYRRWMVAVVSGKHGRRKPPPLRGAPRLPCRIIWLSPAAVPRRRLQRARCTFHAYLDRKSMRLGRHI